MFAQNVFVMFATSKLQRPNDVWLEAELDKLPNRHERRRLLSLFVNAVENLARHTLGFSSCYLLRARNLLIAPNTNDFSFRVESILPVGQVPILALTMKMPL